MYKNIKVIACDIDGTLCKVTYDPNNRTCKTLEKLKEKGYKLGLASGRACDDLMTKAKKWGLNFEFDFLIGLNGAELYDLDTNTTYEYNPISKEDLKEIIELMSEFNPNIHMYKPGIYLSSAETDRAWYSAFKNSRKFVIAKSITEFYDSAYPGIMFRCKASDMNRIETKFNSLINKNYMGYKTQPDLFEFSNINSNKAYALKEYAKLHNINMDDVMAFGDTSNDNEMLSCCHGICMLNGSDDTKKKAEKITDKIDIEDGFAHFIDKEVIG